MTNYTPNKHSTKLANQLYQPSIETLAANVHTIGSSLPDYFNNLGAELSVSNADDLIHVLIAAEDAVRKLRVRLAQEVEE